MEHCPKLWTKKFRHDTSIIAMWCQLSLTKVDAQCEKLDRRRSFTVLATDELCHAVYHTQRPPLCIARCARGSASRGSIWHSVLFVISSTYSQSHSWWGQSLCVFDGWNGHRKLLDDAARLHRLIDARESTATKLCTHTVSRWSSICAGYWY